jgi:osmotically-inducible protein OsmY
MLKSLVVLAAASTMSGPVFAQAAQDQSQTQAQAQAQQPAKPQTVKKRVCEQIDEDSYSRLGNRKICRTIEVPVTSTNGQATQAPAQNDQKGN